MALSGRKCNKKKKSRHLAAENVKKKKNCWLMLVQGGSWEIYSRSSKSTFRCGFGCFAWNSDLDEAIKRLRSGESPRCELAPDPLRGLLVEDEGSSVKEMKLVNWVGGQTGRKRQIRCRGTHATGELSPPAAWMETFFFFLYLLTSPWSSLWIEMKRLTSHSFCDWFFFSPQNIQNELILRW